ncbi:MAG: HIT domain-containing protein [Patescibacteria group bacterium]|nr:HIT domain-containing protein [Patescibacteria group bacterium]MBU1877103.1 HIT domain-containing protein [Patescibacteria group bacterium]
MDCIFCKIAKKELPADIIYENDDIVGFKNINPESPTHLLFIPKKHLEWKDNFNHNDLLILASLINGAKIVAQEKNILNACKLIFNIGQTGHIDHIHLHLLGGWTKSVPKYNI